MNLTHYVRMPITLACLAVLASCGGGGDDEAGSETAFSINPTSFTVEFQAGGGCTAVDNVSEILVLGGTAPYKVRSTSSRVKVEGGGTVPKEGSFKISLTGGCVDPATVVVEDDLGRSTTLTVTATEAAASAATT